MRALLASLSLRLGDMSLAMSVAVMGGLRTTSGSAVVVLVSGWAEVLALELGSMLVLGSLYCDGGGW
jgi:hypothetical protein